MNPDRMKHEEALQLQRLVLHLQSELNKYKTSHSSTRNEYDSQTERSSIANEKLSYKVKKQQKRIELYEKRIKNLTVQRDEAIACVNHLKETQVVINGMNDQLLETLLTLKEDIISEIRNAFHEVETKTTEFNETLTSFTAANSSLDPVLHKEVLQHPETEEIQGMDQRQKELITILEEYVQQLLENNGY